MRRSAPRRVVRIRPGTKAPRILVVDDQLENRDWLMKLLTSIGFSVRGAENGEAAIRVWEEWNPGLILMDVHMPVMDGLEATRRIKAIRAEANTAIVALDRQRPGRRPAWPSIKAAPTIFSPSRAVKTNCWRRCAACLNIVYDYEEAGNGEDEPARLRRLTWREDRLGQLPRELARGASRGYLERQQETSGSADPEGRRDRPTPIPRAPCRSLPTNTNTTP